MSILHSLHFSHETFLDTLYIVNDVLYIVNGCVYGNTPVHTILLKLGNHTEDGKLCAVSQMVCHEIPIWHYLSVENGVKLERL